MFYAFNLSAPWFSIDMLTIICFAVNFEENVCIKMESEEVKHLNIAIIKCDSLKRSLLLSLLHVQILANKYDRKWHEEQIENSILDPLEQMNPMQFPSDGNSLAHTANQTLNSIRRRNSKLVVQLIKVRRSIEAILTKVEFLLRRYGHNNNFSIRYLRRRPFEKIPLNVCKHDRHKNCF